MELKDYTTEELKAEIKRRAEIRRAQKEEEMKKALRCRNCKHCKTVYSPWGRLQSFQCMARTWGKKIERHYIVPASRKACEKFEPRHCQDE